MNKIQEFWNSRSQRDRIFWLAVVGLFLAYLLLQGRWQSGSPLILVSLLVLLIAITVHEFSHAWSADLLGDPTPRYMGRVTLNPLAHLDPAGAIMMVLTTLTGFGIGWGKPVMVSPRNFRLGARLGWGITALAGPASNMLLALFFGLALRLTPHNITWLRSALNVGVIINLSLALFNLLPLPPLDGFTVLLGILSLIRGRWAWQASQTLSGLYRYGNTILIGVLLFSQLVGFNLLGVIITPPLLLLYRFIVGMG